jgi:mycothiol S-conjugate amidase
MSQPLRLMAVHAHPDDEASKGAATTAKYRDQGVEVMVVTCTGGELGDVLNPQAQADVDALGLDAVRRAEMAEAARILDVQHRWLGFIDSGYPEEGHEVAPESFAGRPLDEVTQPLVALIREFRPHVVTTYDETGGYPHPDHIRTHEVTMAAIDAAANPRRFPGGLIWDVPKVYYNQQFTKRRVEALHLALIDADLESPYHDWLERISEGPDMFDKVTTRIHGADYFGIRDQALLAHRTQIDPAGMWFAMPRDIEKQIWPTEEFQLARSIVPVEPLEDDLFAGLRGE